MLCYTIKLSRNSQIAVSKNNAWTKSFRLTFLRCLIYFEIPLKRLFCCSFVQHCINIVYSSMLEFYHKIWYWNPLLNQSFTKPTILLALLELYLQYTPNDRNISWSSFDSFSVYNIMLPYSWSTEVKSYFISKVVLALTLLIKSFSTFWQ